MTSTVTCLFFIFFHMFERSYHQEYSANFLDFLTLSRHGPNLLLCKKDGKVVVYFYCYALVNSDLILQNSILDRILKACQRLSSRQLFYLFHI